MFIVIEDQPVLSSHISIQKVFYLYVACLGAWGRFEFTRQMVRTGRKAQLVETRTFVL